VTFGFVDRMLRSAPGALARV